MKSVYDYFNSIDKKKIKKSCSSKFPDFELDKIELQPSSACQLNCPWCYGKHFSPDEYDMIPFETYDDNVLGCLSNDPVIMIAGLYSDPLLYPEIDKLINAIGVYELRFGLYTNGLALNDKTIKEIITASKKNRKKQNSFVSIDVSALAYKGKLDSVLPKIEKLANIKRLDVNTPILLTNNLLVNNKIVDICKKLKNAGSKNIRLSIPQDPINPRHKKALSIAKQLKNVYWDLPEKQHDKCFSMTNSISIDFAGNVYPCSQVSSTEFKSISYGSVAEKPITEIWHSKKHKEMFNKFNPQHDICRCNNVDNKFNKLCMKYYEGTSSDTK